MGVYDNCNANSHRVTSLGDVYTNETGLDEWVVFTGSHYFQVKEIEVFEIIDETALHANPAPPES
jgi:hypothetical protein